MRLLNDDNVKNHEYIKNLGESTVYTEAVSREKVRDGYMKDLPEDVQNKIMGVHKIIIKAIDDILEDKNYEDLLYSSWAMSCIDDFKTMPTAKGQVGSVRVYKKGKQYECMIQATGHFRNHQYGWIEELLHDFIKNIYSTVRPTIRRKYDVRLDNEGDHGNPEEGFDIYPNKKIAEEIWNLFEDRKTKMITESGEEISNDIYQKLENEYHGESFKIYNEASHENKRNPDLHKELVDDDEEEVKVNPNTDMTELEAKKVLRRVSQGIIEDKNKSVTQYTANIFANIITKNLLPKWSSGYKKLSITLDYKADNIFEFKIPKISQDFIARFIEGREHIDGFLHRIPEIKIRMSPRIFNTMKNPDDAFNFFRSAVQYYDSKVDKYSRRLMAETMRLNHSLKHLISTTNLSGIVSYPIQLLFKFDDVDMSSQNTFVLSKDDINTVNQFVRSIYTKYASPEKEKKKIVDDMKTMVRSLREYGEVDENIKQLSYLPEAVEKYLFGGFEKEIQYADDMFIREQVDDSEPSTAKVGYLQEKFGVKKLKKIPNDLVAYISIETEAIRDANDKMMIASYCLGKIEIVEWYIELLEVGSKRYVVPHTKPYLENVRTQLLACYKKIMDTPIKDKTRPIIDIQYPKGYEG